MKHKLDITFENILKELFNNTDICDVFNQCPSEEEKEELREEIKKDEI